MLSIAAMPRRATPCACWIPRASFSAWRITARLRRSRCACSPTRPEIIDRTFFRARLAAALAHRERVVHNSDAYRLVFSEGDLLPGLIVDRYGPYLALQTLNQGMDRARDVIVDCLQELLAPAGILARNDASVRKLEGSAAGSGHAGRRNTGTSAHPDERLAARSRSAARPKDRRVSGSARKLPGGGTLGARARARLLHLQRRLCAACGGTGRIGGSRGFFGGALATAEANARANGIANVHFRQADVFEFLSGIERRYSMVVLDPPAFAKSRRAVEDAARGYKDINLRALRLLDSGGVLVTCSCSHHMSEGAFYEVIAQAALDAGKTLRVLERRTQASDHPILLTVPETMYLKCLVLEVL